MKAAVYSGTRNLYHDMAVAAKSLLRNSNVDRIYFLIEDDKFPEELSPKIVLVNVSNQKFFPREGANYKTPFSYMSLMRVCYTKLFPDLDKILQLDVDTIVTDNIDSLWDVDLADKYFAAVEEYHSKYKPFGKKYYNIGVAMFNLENIRNDKKDDLLIHFLNRERVPYVDQDACNKILISGVVELPVRYNETIVTGYTDNPAIVHYAGFKDVHNNPRCPRKEYFKLYEELPWENTKNVRKRSNRSTNVWEYLSRYIQINLRLG